MDFLYLAIQRLAPVVVEARLCGALKRGIRIRLCMLQVSKGESRTRHGLEFYSEGRFLDASLSSRRLETPSQSLPTNVPALSLFFLVIQLGTGVRPATLVRFDWAGFIVA